MLTKEEFAQRLKNACAAVIAAEGELTEIDAKFGDADHGFTMAKVCNAISAAIDASVGGIQTMLDDAAMAVMSINGGSAVPLWNTWLDGMQEDAPEAEQIDVEGIKAIFVMSVWRSSSRMMPLLSCTKKSNRKDQAAAHFERRPYGLLTDNG